MAVFSSTDGVQVVRLLLNAKKRVIIEQVIHNGGQAVFMPQELMGDDLKIALATHYWFKVWYRLI